MGNGYKIFWTDFALEELEATCQYLESNFTEKECKKLASEIERVIFLIQNNPLLFQESHSKTGVRKAIVMKYNSMYYRIRENSIEILSYFSNRQNPNKIKY